MKTMYLQVLVLLCGFSVILLNACSRGKIKPLPKEKMGKAAAIEKLNLQKLEGHQQRHEQIIKTYYKDYDPSSEGNRNLLQSIEGISVMGEDIAEKGPGRSYKY